MYVVELLGWLSGLLLGVCAIPQAVKCFQQKHAHGVSYGLIILWLTGEIFACLYISAVPMLIQHKLPLLVNYIVNLASLAVICYYRFYPKTKLV